MGSAGCVVFLLGLSSIVICVYTVPRMVLDGVLSLAEGILLACGMVLLIALAGALSKVAPDPSIALVLAFVSTLGALPYVCYVLRGRGDRRIAQQDIDRSERALAFDPNLNPARVALGDAYRGLGLYDTAASYYEAALEREPDSRAAQRGLDECLRLQSVARGETWGCHICSSANDPRDLKCRKCKTPRGRVVGTAPAHRITPWIYGGLQGAVLALMLAGELTHFGALSLSITIAAAFHVLYRVAMPSDG